MTGATSEYPSRRSARSRALLRAGRAARACGPPFRYLLNFCSHRLNCLRR